MQRTKQRNFSSYLNRFFSSDYLYLFLIDALIMDHLSERLENLRSQVQKLGVAFKQLNTKNEDFEKENKELREKLSRKGEKIKALKDERELIINAKSLKDVGLSSKEARHKINELIRGIDKCIAQLNQ